MKHLLFSIKMKRLNGNNELFLIRKADEQESKGKLKDGVTSNVKYRIKATISNGVLNVC